MISKYERTKTPQIKQNSFNIPSKLDRIPYYKYRPGPGYYEATVTKDMDSVIKMKFSKLGKIG